MKKIILFALALSFAPAVFAEDPPPTTKDIQVAVSGVFVPGRFDPTSETYVIANGVFPNGCYKWGRAEINNIDTFTHEVKTFATVTQGMCLMVLVPFQNDIRFGKLPTGKHTLRFLSADGTYLEKTIDVN